MDWNLLLTDLPTLIAVIVGVPAVLAAYIVGGEFLVRRLPDKNRPQVRPWIWVGPALLLVTGFLVVPAIGTLISSFQDRQGNFVGLSNFASQLGGFPTGGAWIAIRDNLFWLIFYTLFVLAFGLALAVLFDRVPYENIVKSLIFMPMAISSVALVVIWKFMYAYQPPGQPQTGTLNFILNTVFHQDPRTWIQDETPLLGLIPLNNLALIAAAVWGIVGFSMVILSAALKGIPGDLLEAARVDGAGEITIFRRVIFPLMMPTVVVVGTTLVIFALKAFDVVYAMTAGNYDTDVLANRMYKLLYFSSDTPGASAVAVVLLLTVIPVLIFNLRQFRAVEARR
ncbi:MAG: sugar ABC transporter permease [Chloroflexi bacterium]|jgi:alpha-glucoside transport system permease protein|nr:MAG: sugar ABC transporter permease [Chloroflexota bacterium]TME54187.1 MAG: sugar ABC transporter permease [Chloroflexota bacterium]